MSHSLLGRLPPLQAIGRSKCIDLDEPPPTSEEDDDPEDLVDSYLQSLEKDAQVVGPVYRFETEHATSVGTALLRGFRVLRPGSHYCKKVSPVVTGFTHCQKSVSFAAKHRELDRLLEARAQLDFTKDLLSRTNAFGVFVGEIQQLVREESLTWQEICRDCLSTAPTTKLELLCGLCEDLRMQLNQWNSIKQAMHTDYHLRSLLPSLCSNVRIVRRRLLEMSEAAIVWLGRLILVGLKVLAHCDLERIGQDSLWNIARGLEEYNHIILSTVRLPSFLDDPPLSSSSSSSSFGTGSFLLPADLLLRSGFGRRGNVVPLAKVLRLVARERAKYAAASAKIYFTGSKEFLGLLKNGRLPLYSWSHRTSSLSPADHIDAIKPKQSPNTSSGNSASKRHSNGNLASLSTTSCLLVTDDLLAPDLSDEISPLIDFARRESTFIGRFLQIICHSTNLIKKQSNQFAADSQNDAATAAATATRTSIPRLRKLRPKTITFGAPAAAAAAAPACTANLNTGFNSDLDNNTAGGDNQQHAEEPASSSNKGNSECGEVTNTTTTTTTSTTTTDAKVVETSSSRKTVSWSDSSLAVSIQQVTHDYVRILWMNFADHLYASLVSADWEGGGGGGGGSSGAKDARDQLGSVALCPDTLTMIIQCMVQHAAFGDTFPLASRFALAGLSLRLQAAAACAAWDAALNSSLASAAADKCQSVELSSDIYITTTGKLLHETYQPLKSVLSTLASFTGPQSTDGSAGILSWSDRVTTSVLLLLLKRLIVSSDVSYIWCSDKMQQLIASRAVASFLLVAFADLQILTEENDHAFNVCQHLRDQLMTSSSSSSKIIAADGGAICDIEKSWTQANEKRCHLQALVSSSQKHYHQMCLSSARDFFQNEMPAGKEWKRKGGEVLPIQHLEYIERAVDSLLEPVVAGVNRLRPSAQLDALTTVITDICDAWTTNILTKKIRFSYHGACQLELDILYLRTWLTSYISDTEICQRLASLDFLRYLDCVVILLKQQPSGHQGRRSGSRVRQQPTIRNTEKGFKDACTDGTQSISNTSTCTPSSDTNEDTKNGVLWDTKMAASSAGDRSSRSYTTVSASASLEDGDLDGQTVPHKDQWLALRVQGGSRNWPKLGSCFNNNASA